MEWDRRILRHDSFVMSDSMTVVFWFDHGDENFSCMTRTLFYGDKAVRTSPPHCSFFFDLFPRTARHSSFLPRPPGRGWIGVRQNGTESHFTTAAGAIHGPHWDTRPELNGPQKAGSGRRPPSRRPLDALKRGKSEKGGLEPDASPAPSTAPPEPRAATGSARTAPPDPRGPHSARRDKPCSGAA